MEAEKIDRIPMSPWRATVEAIMGDFSAGVREVFGGWTSLGYFAAPWRSIRYLSDELHIRWIYELISIGTNDTDWKNRLRTLERRALETFAALDFLDHETVAAESIVATISYRGDSAVLARRRTQRRRSKPNYQ